MVELYYDPTCPFCHRVLRFLEQAGIAWQPKELSLRRDSAHRSELLALGGKAQVPFLVDRKSGVSLYESLDIIDHLRRHHGTADGSPT